MRALALDTIGILVLSLLVIVAGTGLVQSFYGDVRETLPYRITEGINNLVYTVFYKTEYNICTAYLDKRVSYQDFMVLLTSMKAEGCNYTSVTLDFSLTKDDLKLIKDDVGANDVMYTRENMTFGGGLLVINGNLGRYPLKYDDVVEVWTAGEPEEDVYLKVTQEGCDPYDDVCNERCSFKEGVCDPLCYSEEADGRTCDLDCVDINGDGRIGREDLDGICDPDCYNNYTNPYRAYDPDCAKDLMKARYAFEGICEPDSNGVEDGVCDRDCAQENRICDPDCNGEIADGNPAALLDRDCYVCNPVQNCFCSRGCTAADNDPDCPDGYQGVMFIENCCGNDLCEDGEDCSSCPADCPGGGESCETFGLEPAVCCPDASDADSYGCTKSRGLSEGGECSCREQCSDGLNCNEGLIDGSFCCPEDKKWDGGECTKFEPTYKILIIPVNWQNKLDYSQTADSIGNYYLERLPLKECLEQFELLKADLSTDYGSQWRNGYCDLSALVASEGCYRMDRALDVLRAIALCGREYTSSTGKDFDYVVGVDDDDIGFYSNGACDRSVGGWSDGGGGNPSVIVEGTDITKASGITTHELGHEFTFGEQYCDCTGVSGYVGNGVLVSDMGPYVCGTNHPINPLREVLGCGGRGSSCDLGFGNTPPYAGRTVGDYYCVWVHGNFDRLGQDTDGDGSLDSGQRSAMSNKALYPAPETGHYSSDEYNVLLNDQRLRCK